MNELVIAPGSEVLGGDRTAPQLSLSQPQKAAIILSIIAPEDAAEILKGFDESVLMRFAKAVSELRPVGADALEIVVGEFLLEIGDAGDVRGGVDQVRKYLSQFMDDENVDKIINDVLGSKHVPVWERLGEAPTAATSSYLALEHPQTVAVVLSKLRPDRAAGILENLDRELAQIAVIRMSRIPTIDPETVSLVEETIEKDFLSAINRSSATVKPAEIIGNLMNNVSSEVREQFLQYLEETDSGLASEVTRVMFTFADIATRLPTSAVSGVVRDVEEEKLMMALKHAKDTENPSFDFIMSNLSKRLSERLVEDIEAMEPVKDKEAEAAQMEIIGIIQKKAKLGEIKLYEPEPE